MKKSFYNERFSNKLPSINLKPIGLMQSLHPTVQCSKYKALQHFEMEMTSPIHRKVKTVEKSACCGPRSRSLPRLPRPSVKMQLSGWADTYCGYFDTESVDCVSRYSAQMMGRGG